MRPPERKRRQPKRWDSVPSVRAISTFDTSDQVARNAAVQVKSDGGVAGWMVLDQGRSTACAGSWTPTATTKWTCGATTRAESRSIGTSTRTSTARPTSIAGWARRVSAGGSISNEDGKIERWKIHLGGGSHGRGRRGSGGTRCGTLPVHPAHGQQELNCSRLRLRAEAAAGDRQEGRRGGTRVLGRRRQSIGGQCEVQMDQLRGQPTGCDRGGLGRPAATLRSTTTRRRSWTRTARRPKSTWER